MSKAKIIQCYFQNEQLFNQNEKVIDNPESAYSPLENDDPYVTNT